MEWINQNSGLIVLIAAAVIIVLLVIGLCLTYYIKKMIAVQKLTFLGLYSIELNARENYAKLTIGNRSLNDICITELGIKNGNVNFNLTSLYREKTRMTPNAKIIVNQRDSISFELTSEELEKAFLIDATGKRKPVIKLSLYAVDVAGTLHQGSVPAVRKLMRLLRLNAINAGTAVEPTRPIEPTAPVAPKAPAERKAPKREQAEVKKSKEPPYMPPEEEEAQFLEPETKAPEVKQPEVKQPEVKAPEVKAPEVKQPEAKTPSASRSEELMRLEQALRSVSHGAPAASALHEPAEDDPDDEDIGSAIS